MRVAAESGAEKLGWRRGRGGELVGAEDGSSQGYAEQERWH